MSTNGPSSTTKKPGPLRRFLALLGPGLVAGAADDDPSGIATYSVVGAQYGTRFLYTSLLTWPLMAIGYTANQYQRGTAALSRIGISHTWSNIWK